jgi:hypothetical protein
MLDDNAGSQKTQHELAQIIDIAVDCWHEVADEHDIAHCNCFRESFARRLIELGIFIGYDKL